ncbi:hypothetical protein ACP3P6_10075 [Enterobacter mori]
MKGFSIICGGGKTDGVTIGVLSASSPVNDSTSAIKSERLMFRRYLFRLSSGLNITGSVDNRISRPFIGVLYSHMTDLSAIVNLQ